MRPPTTTRPKKLEREPLEPLRTTMTITTISLRANPLKAKRRTVKMRKPIVIRRSGIIKRNLIPTRRSTRRKRKARRKNIKRKIRVDEYGKGKIMKHQEVKRPRTTAQMINRNLILPKRNKQTRPGFTVQKSYGRMI